MLSRDLQPLQGFQVDLEDHWLSNRKFRLHKTNCATRLDLVEVFYADKEARKPAQLLQIALVNPRDRSGANNETADMEAAASKRCSLDELSP